MASSTETRAFSTRIQQSPYARRYRFCSKRRQVGLQLPRLDLRMVLAPFVPLEPKEFVGDRAEALPDDRVRLQMGKRFGEALGQRTETTAGHGLEVGGVEIAEVGLPGVELALDAVEAGGEVGGDAKVG